MEAGKLDFYISMTHFLGAALGPRYEIVLHILEDKNSYIASIVNNQVSGRTTDSPLTSFALDLIKSEEYKKRDFVSNYKAKIKTGATVQGSTFFLKDSLGKLEGMLCINTDFSKHIELAHSILELANINSDSLDSRNVSPAHVTSNKVVALDNYVPEEVVEVLSDNISDIIEEVVDPTLFDEGYTISQERKIELVELLDKKGVFQIKGSISQVASVLNVSESSVYRYLKIISKR